MATQNASSWTLAQLLVAAERFTFEDGRADINETKALIGLVHPFAEMDTDLILILLDDIECAVGGSPVNNHILQKRIILRSHTTDGLLKCGSTVICNRYDGNAGELFHLFTFSPFYL